MNRKDKSENGDQNIQNSCSQEIISTRELLETQVFSATFHPILCWKFSKDKKILPFHDHTATHSLTKCLTCSDCKQKLHNEILLLLITTKTELLWNGFFDEN